MLITKIIKFNDILENTVYLFLITDVNRLSNNSSIQNNLSKSK